jgi:hypothetical protein
MRIDPAIAAMRRDPARQRRAQAAMKAAGDDWRREPRVTAVLADLERFGAGAPLEACPELDAIFTLGANPERLTGPLCRRIAAVLAREPFGHPPFRHSFDGSVSTLLLAQEGRAQLILQAREPGRCDHDSASYSDAVLFEAVLAGSAHARVADVGGAPGNAIISTRSVDLLPGTRLTLDLSCEALQVLQVERRLVSLRLHRNSAVPCPSRCYSMTDGKLLQQAAGDIRFSRQEMMLAVLGRMERREAVPEMAAIARAPGDDSLRWQALRECLALDAAEGFRALTAMAVAAGDPLAGPAGALRAQLVEQHPQLLAVEGDRCPA